MRHNSGTIQTVLFYASGWFENLCSRFKTRRIVLSLQCSWCAMSEISFPSKSICSARLTPAASIDGLRPAPFFRGRVDLKSAIDRATAETTASDVPRVTAETPASDVSRETAETPAFAGRFISWPHRSQSMTVFFLLIFSVPLARRGGDGFASHSHDKLPCPFFFFCLQAGGWLPAVRASCCLFPPEQRQLN